jgi:hypothetical protein
MKSILNPHALLLLGTLAAFTTEAKPVKSLKFIVPASPIEKHIKAENEEIIKLARAAYVYGLPIVLTDFTRQVSGVPNNVFVHGHKFPDHTSRLVVAPNNDTNYSSAFLDLGDDAVVVTIPDTKDRYFVVPLMDAWTNVFASFGKRNTGTHAQTYVITGPHWHGTIPAGLPEVKSPTDLVWIIGRIQVNSPEDQINFVSPIQDQFKLTLLSDWGKTNAASVKNTTHYSVDLPEIKEVQSHQLTAVQAVKQIPVDRFFNYLNQLLVKNPGLPADSATLAKLAKIGIKPGGKFDLNDFDKETQDALKNVPNEIYQAFDNIKASADFKPRNGTQLGHYGTDYLTRAAVAYKGLGALPPEEATYIAYNTDDANTPLNGSTTNYVIHFEAGKLPPAKAFWSLTMYDKDRYLSDNPIRRYAIGDRNKLKFNADGSLDIYLQHNDPGADKQSNWLPAPADSFNVILRIYVPTDEYLHDKNTWVNPPIKKQG